VLHVSLDPTMASEQKQRRHTPVGNFLPLLLITIPFVLAACDSPQPPDRSEMRAHIVATLSDTEIRALYAEAKKQQEAVVANEKKRTEEFLESRAENAAVNGERCKDIAFRTKNPNVCDPPIPPLMLLRNGEPPTGYESVETIFERNLLGLCNFVRTVREAKKKGCLP
jgi:hypothetical protein